MPGKKSSITLIFAVTQINFIKSFCNHCDHDSLWREVIFVSIRTKWCSVTVTLLPGKKSKKKLQRNLYLMQNFNFFPSLTRLIVWWVVAHELVKVYVILYDSYNMAILQFWYFQSSSITWCVWTVVDYMVLTVWWANEWRNGIRNPGHLKWTDGRCVRVCSRPW